MGKRSNGCITCRRRKVKCDEVKPACERCRKATYKCAGYDQPWLSEAPYQREAYQRFLVRDELYRTRHQALLPQESTLPPGFLPAERVTQQLHLSAFSDNICRSFVFHRLCSGGTFSKAISWWLNPAPRAEIQSRTLVSATRAMTAAFFGRIHQQPDVINEGSKAYGDALHNLSSDLSHRVKAYTFETLGATMALEMYEMINLSSDSCGRITHAGGIEKLMLARGPRLHKSYPEKEIYLEARYILVSNGIFSCQRTFLDEQNWKDVPWEDNPSAKPPFEYLVDVLSDIPYFLQQVAHDNTPTIFGSPKRLDLQKQILERLKKLKEVREAWHVEYSTPLWRVPLTLASLQGSDNVKPPFDAAFYFNNVFRAYEYCTFQMACILLFLLYQDLSPDNLQPVEDAFPGIFPNGTVQYLVRNICRCTEYLCLDQNGSRGYIVLQIPATMAYLAVEPETPEAKWLYHVCKRRARSSGFGLGDFAMDQVTPLRRWMASCRDRHRNPEKSGNFSEGRPCWARGAKERAMAIVHASSQSEAALRLRSSRRPEEAVWHPP